MTLQFTRRSLLLVFFGLAPVHLLSFPRQLRIIDHWFGLSEKRFFFVTTRTFVSWLPCISGTFNGNPHCHTDSSRGLPGVFMPGIVWVGEYTTFRSVRHDAESELP